MRALRDVLQALPVNSSRVPGKTVRELAREDSGRPRRSPKSVNKYLLNFAALFNWAVREELADRNPAEGLTVPDPRRPDEQRKASTADQLRRLFGPGVVQTWMPEPLYLPMLMAGFPLLVYPPTHVVLVRVFGGR